MNKSTLVLAAALMASGSAFAGTVDTATQSEAFNLNFGDPTSAITFNGFDSSLGTLTSVHVTLTVNSETLTSSAFDAGAPTTITDAYSTGKLSVTGSDGLSVTDDSLSTNPFTGTIIPGNNPLGSANLSSAVSDSSALLNPPTDLSAYIGGSNAVTLDLGNNTQQSGSCVYPAFCGTNGSAAGTITVYYDYTPAVINVPEPASLALMGIGFVGLSSIRRKKA